MDRQAERWTAILDDESIDAETNFPTYNEATKDRIFKALQTWLEKRRKLFPDEKPREGAGVTSMRDWLNDPEARGELESMIRKISGAPDAPAGKAKPAKRDKAAETTKQAEGSALHALVFDGEGLTEGEGE